MSTKASLTLDQAHTILTKLGSVTDEVAPNQKLSFCETDIAWMTSSSTVRSIWSGLYAVGLSYGWNCDLTSLPKLAGRVTEVFEPEVGKIESKNKADESANLVKNALVGLAYLRTFHYDKYPAKMELVQEAMTILTQLAERIDARVEELTPKQIVVENPVPIAPTLQELHNNLRQRYINLQIKVRTAHSNKATFNGIEEFSSHIKQKNAVLIEQVPAEIQGDGPFNKLRADYIRLIKLYGVLEIEAKGYNVSLDQ